MYKIAYLGLVKCNYLHKCYSNSVEYVTVIYVN